MGIFRMGFLALILCIATSVKAGGDIPITVVDWIEKNVVKVYTSKGRGTGFFIKPSMVITACHVTGSLKLVYVSPEGYLNTYPAAVLICDPVTDIALLQLYDGVPQTMPTQIAEENPRVGKITYGAGYPLGLPLTIVDGHWQRSGVEYRYGNTAHVAPGDSGGPLVIWEDELVKVVGLRTSMMGAGPSEEEQYLFPNLAFIVDVPTLRSFIDENL